MEGVIACQEAVKKEGQKFVKSKLQALEKCADAMLNVTLLTENGVVTDPAEITALEAKADAVCASQNAKITKASTKFVDKVIDACEPVAAIVLAPDPPPDGDPLGFVALADFLGVTPLPTTAVEMAGLLCVGHELLVDLLGNLAAPRALRLIGTIPPIPLDPRCVGFQP